jgi:DNA polymerase-3 subunit epsilon
MKLPAANIWRSSTFSSVLGDRLRSWSDRHRMKHVISVAIDTKAHAAQAALRHLQAQVARAQAELADLEAALSIERRKIDILQGTLFAALRVHYERRDRLKLLIEYRNHFLEERLRSHKAAENVRDEFEQADAETREEYESTATAFAKQRELTPAEELELKVLWKKLVKLFHPDTIVDDAAKRETYQKLTQAINHAKDTGDLHTLREIANDAEAFIRQQGWAHIKLEPEKEIKALQRLVELLQSKIAEVVEAMTELKESPEYELSELWRRDPSILDKIAARQRRDIDAECVDLKRRARKLQKQIEELTGEPAFGQVEEL